MHTMGSLSILIEIISDSAVYTIPYSFHNVFTSAYISYRFHQRLHVNGRPIRYEIVLHSFETDIVFPSSGQHPFCFLAMSRYSFRYFLETLMRLVRYEESKNSIGSDIQNIESVTSKIGERSPRSLQEDLFPSMRVIIVFKFKFKIGLNTWRSLIGTGL